jgi:glycine amidinotransferase/scyllo-inosamine-4-phosphate amidinotransferase 1
VPLKINSHNEWDKLREIIVGSAKGTTAVLTWARPGPIPEDVARKAFELAKDAYPQWFLDEVQEDLDGLAAAITKAGVKVYRPSVHDIGKMYATPFWQSTGNNVYNVRDLHLVVGNSVIESPSHLRSRYFEATALYDIWYEYFEQGFRWICGPRPRLDRRVLEPYYRDESERKLTPEDIRYKELTGGRVEKLHKLNENEIVFEAANTVRMGRDLIYLVSSSGNHKSARWLQSVLGEEYRVHTTEDIYRSSHIDSTVLCLRPGLVMLNSKRVNEKNCPTLLDKWDKIWFEDVAPTSQPELDFQKSVRDPIAKQLEALGFETNLNDMSSPWVGMNFLSLDPQTVVVDERQTNLMRVLEKRGFTIVTVRMRHIYTQGGGIHCATLDTVRDSKLEDYFS